MVEGRRSHPDCRLRKGETQQAQHQLSPSACSRNLVSKSLSMRV
jgi:hypothetical protein